MLAKWGHKTFFPQSNIIPTLQGGAGKVVVLFIRKGRLKMNLNRFCVFRYYGIRLEFGQWGFNCF